MLTRYNAIVDQMGSRNISRECFRFLFFVTLAIHVILLAYSSLKHSPTVGEVGHIAAGVSHWRFGNFGLFRVNPPLVRLIATLPVVATLPKEDWHRASTDFASRSEWVVGEDFIAANQDRAPFLFALARFACIPISLLGAYACSMWASALYGRMSGYLALTLWCFCPAILAHAPTFGPDVGAAAFGVTAAYIFWKWLRNPCWKTAFIAGVILGLAELTKLTWLVLFLLWPALWIAWKLGEMSNKSAVDNALGKCLKTEKHLRGNGLQFGLIILLAIYVINLGYGFQGTFHKLGECEFVSQLLAGPSNDIHTPIPDRNRFAASWLGDIPIPLPKDYLMGIDRQKWDFERGLPSYLRGEWADHGWWHYYIYALAIKLPLGTWCMIALAIGVTIFVRGGAATWLDEMVVLAPGLTILIFVSSQTGFSVHSRYIIPALPFLFIWISKVARVFEMRPFSKRWLAMAVAVVVALTWSVGSSLSIFPHSLSYFNELAIVLPTPADASYPKPIKKNERNGTLAFNNATISAGPRNGPRHLLDSNIDWGQDLFYLKDWLDEHPGVKLDGLAFYGSYPATMAGIPETPMPATGREYEWFGPNQPQNQLGPKPGWYALSVNYIYGRSQQYRYFLNFEPIAMAGYSIYIYHITLDEANRVRRELGLPELEAAAANGKAERGGQHG